MHLKLQLFPLEEITLWQGYGRQFVTLNCIQAWIPTYSHHINRYFQYETIARLDYDYTLPSVSIRKHSTSNIISLKATSGLFQFNLKHYTSYGMFHPIISSFHQQTTKSIELHNFEPKFGQAFYVGHSVQKNKPTVYTLHLLNINFLPKKWK
jgi:hypothetical protein